MKKTISVFIVGLMLLSIIPFSISSDEITVKTIYVDDDATLDWYDSTHVHTIQEGIDVASDGDTIYIYDGLYNPSENIHVYKELLVIGETRDGVIVEHEHGSEELSIRAKNVEISTITFRNFRITNQGIYDNSIITNNVFIIDNEEKHWNPEVIYIAGSNNEISNNIMTFTGTYDGSKNPKTGIFFQCYESKVTNNVITGVGSSTTALHILDRSYWVDNLVKGKNLIEGNTFTLNGCGISLTPTLRPGYNSRIVHNNFIDNNENANFVIVLPSIVDIIKNNAKRLIYLAESIITDDSFSLLLISFGFGLSLNYWDENYWDDPDAGLKIIPGTLQSAGLINQLFHYVFPWLDFDMHPVKNPYSF